MNDGFYYDLPFEQYAAIDAINGSSIVHMRRSPMYYRHIKDNPQPPTPAMILGTATHRMILEPQRVGDMAIWGTEANQKVRNGKVWEAFKAEHADKLIVTVKECKQMVGMAVGAHKHLPIKKYADAKGKTEVSMVWTDKVSGRRFKARVDKIIPQTHTIPDLKTCRDCRSYQFGIQAYALGYYIKEAMYWHGYKTLTGHEPHCKLMAIESKAPHESAVYRVTKDTILQGLEELDVLLKTLAECEETNTWPAAEQDETDLVMPAWATVQSDTEFELDMETA